jgi:glycosyltransferase involved in cell wall biosynthesis
MTSNQPKISIITVVRNAAADLEKTICSVTGQDYSRVEFIVIDGGSTDGTVDVLKSQVDHVSYWVSEPDKGIYDAMNKGLAKATGEWVNFMNAGDVFFNNRVLTEIFEQDMEGADILYGDSIAHYPAFKAMRKALPPEDLWKGMICCHQAMLFRTTLFKDRAYTPELHSSADYEMILWLYHSGKNFRYVPSTIAVFDTRGTSNLNMIRSARSNLEILKSVRTLKPQEKRFHYRVIFQSGLTEWIYRLLPVAVINSMLRRRYRNQIVNESSQP